jgi:cell division initiation protein
MNLSAHDLRRRRFRSAIRGYNKVEVTAFLSAFADDYEQALRETEKLRQDVARMEAVINEHREHERTLKITLVTAQRLADEMKAQAELESQRLVRDAEGRAGMLTDKAQSRLEDIQREIDGLRLKRKDVEGSIEATIQTLRKTLDFVREQDAREAGDRSLLQGTVA